MDTQMDTQLVTIFTGVSAAAAVIYTIVTARLLRTTRRAVDATLRAIELTALMHENELMLRVKDKNPDGTNQFSQSYVFSLINDLENFKDELKTLK